jgi:hypothetical protein
MHPQYFIDSGRKQTWLLAELSLKLRVFCQIVAQDSHASGYGAQFTDGPIAQDAYDLLVV